MLLAYAAVAALCLWGLSLAPPPERWYDDALSRDKTACVKGAFVLLIFLRHFGQYIHPGNGLDTAFFALDHVLGQLIVVPFLFYSGYGILKSIDAKGAAYVRALPTRRVLRLLLEFDSAVLVFWLVQTLRGKEYGTSDVLLALLAWKPLANSNWFICVTLVLYLITWLSFTLLPRRRTAALVCVTALSVLCMLIFWKTQESRWYNTLLCYAAGLWYAQYEEQLEGSLHRHALGWLLGSGAAFVLSGLAFAGVLPAGKNNSLLVYPLAALSFALLLVRITHRISLNNPALHWLGGHVFGIYIWQRMPMNVLREIKLQKTHRYVYFLVCFAATLALAWAFQRMTGAVERRLSVRTQKGMPNARGANR